MRYSKLFRLKYQRGFSTQQLMKLYPHDAQRISEIALLYFGQGTLQKILSEKSEKKELSHLIHLKKKYACGDFYEG